MTFHHSGRLQKLVIEAKGQWHKEIYIAATSQLYERYSQHTAAEGQGVYLVYWYGRSEKVANKKIHNMNNPVELRQEIQSVMSEDLKPFIDIVVLDLEI